MVALALAVSAVVTLITTPLVIRFARAGNLLDGPGSRKVHEIALPRLGGIAVALGVLAGLAVALGVEPGLGRTVLAARQVAAVACGAVVMFLAGVVDDVRRLRPRYKLLSQLVAASIVVASGLMFDHTGDVPLRLAGAGLGLVWIVGATNAVNLIDGLDGLASGFGVLACATLAAICNRAGEGLLATNLVAVVGALAAFLLFNFHPARIFLGDGGSQLLGFLLAVGSMTAFRASGHDPLVIASAALVLGIPILDTLFSILRRLAQKRSIFRADREHVHHRLLSRLGQRGAVLVLWGVEAVVCGLGFATLATVSSWRCCFAIAGLAVLIEFFHRAGVIPLRSELS